MTRAVHFIRTPVFTGLLLALACLLGCCTDPVNGEKYFCLSDVSDADEVKLGAQYAPDFISQSGGLYPDAQVQKALSRIVIDDMAKKSHRADLPWEFFILNTSQINAFALPGGKVFVTRGLLARLESEAQFAHLMGHEIGHVSHRHSIRGQNRAQILELVVGAASIAEQSQRKDESDDPLWASQVTGVLGQLALLKFSRDQELQSDERGVDYALLAGYDPREATKTFQLFLDLKKQSGQSESPIKALMATHPLDSTRIRRIDEYIATAHPQVAKATNLAISEPGWAQVRARIQQAEGVYASYEQAMALVMQSRKDGNRSALDQAEARVRDAANTLPGHATLHTGLGVIAMERDDRASARQHLDRACRLDPGHFEARYTRGLLHQRSGQPRLAVVDFQAAEKAYPSSASPTFQLGRAYQSLGENSNAIRAYQDALDKAPQWSAIESRARDSLSQLRAR